MMVVFVSLIVWLEVTEDAHHVQPSLSQALIELHAFVLMGMLLMEPSVFQLYLNVLKEWRELMETVFVKMDSILKPASAELSQDAQLNPSGTKIS